MKTRWLAAALAGVLVLTSCSDDETASGELVGPLAFPRVAESVLALDVFEGVPLGITDVFLQDEIVYLWVRWEALEPPHEVEAVWFDPSAEEVDFTVLNIDDGPPEQITVFSLDLTPFSETGFWEVEIWMDGELQCSHLFEVVPAPF